MRETRDVEDAWRVGLSVGPRAGSNMEEIMKARFQKWPRWKKLIFISLLPVYAPFLLLGAIAVLFADFVVGNPDEVR